MDFNKFSLCIALRMLLIMVNVFVFGLFAIWEGYHMATVLAIALMMLQSVWLITFVSKTNAELVRFFDAARHADYSQQFTLSPLGSGFGELGQTFSDILNKFQQTRANQEEELRHLKAMIEHVPVPLLSVDHRSTLTLWNNAARKLFSTHHVTQVHDLNPFGEAFAQHIRNIKVGEKPLVRCSVDGMTHQLSISASQITLSSKREMLISLHDIQTELDTAQLQAWQDLVTVLTHEMMNSISPVASLANTTVDLINDTKQKSILPEELTEDLNDISDAVETVARRSDGLIHFVNSYRKLTKLPTPNKIYIRIDKVFQQCTSLATQHWQRKGIHLITHIAPATLKVKADNDMLEQVLLNLLQNAEHAVAECESPEVKLIAYLNTRGHVGIEVKDNGQGIPEEIACKIFVPFYTTKPQGSGVGLALSRQIMLAHGGSITHESNDNDGTTFRMLF